eukprot:SAG31_NODE_11151_length_1060_cov_1.980229_1_plen_319_part_10
MLIEMLDGPAEWEVRARCSTDLTRSKSALAVHAAFERVSQALPGQAQDFSVGPSHAEDWDNISTHVEAPSLSDAVHRTRNGARSMSNPGQHPGPDQPFLTWQVALSIIESQSTTLLPRPARLEDVDASVCLFLENRKYSAARRSQGQDIWTLNGQKKVPRGNPRFICRYGYVTDARSREHKAKVVAFQPHGDREKEIWTLYHIKRDQISVTPNAGLEQLICRGAKALCALTDSEAAAMLQSLAAMASGPGNLEPATIPSARPLRFDAAEGQIYYECPLQHRRRLRGNGKDMYKFSGVSPGKRSDLFGSQAVVRTHGSVR